MEDLTKLCRLCMTAPKTGEMTSIFEDQEKSFSMKIITCFSVEVHKSDQLPKQMCSPCVYQLEKLYIFRKQCRKADTKFRSFLRKLKSKKIRRLDELSDDEDEENGGEDTNLAFVQDYERQLIEAKVKEHMESDRKNLLKQIKRGLFEALDNLDGEGETVEDAAPQTAPEPTFLADLELEEEEEEEIEDEAEEKNEPLHSSPSPPRKKLAPRQAKKKKTPVKKEVYPSDSEESVVENDPEEVEEASAVIMRSGLIHSCKDCNRKFHTPAELTKHSKLHKSSRNVCDDCGKCFSSSGSLFRHQKIHRDEKQYKCDVCGKSFTQKGSLLRHAVVHSDKGERPFACDDCDKSFSQRHLLTQHVSKAHSELAVTYLFRCNECPKTFRHSSGLSRHILTHSGKRYPCTVCNQTLSDYSALKRHTKTLHFGGAKEKKGTDQDD